MYWLNNLEKHSCFWSVWDRSWNSLLQKDLQHWARMPWSVVPWVVTSKQTSCGGERTRICVSDCWWWDWEECVPPAAVPQAGSAVRCLHMSSVLRSVSKVGIDWLILHKKGRLARVKRWIVLCPSFSSSLLCFWWRCFSLPALVLLYC